MSKWITVKTFSNRMAADLARGLLDENGIDCRIQADDVGGMRPELAFSTGVRILVQEPDAVQASVLLQ